MVILEDFMDEFYSFLGKFLNQVALLFEVLYGQVELLNKCLDKRLDSTMSTLVKH